MRADKWEGAELALRQWGAAQEDLDAHRRGRTRDSWKVLGRIVAGLGAEDPLVMLDVGCGLGAAAEILADVSGRTLDYWGMDSNTEAIYIARSEFPEQNFIQGDILTTGGPDVFDLAMSNGTLNHIHDWETALRNIAKLTRRWVILHRLWVYVDKTPTSGLIREAYNRSVWHMRINEGEMTGLMAEEGFRLVENVSSDGKDAPEGGRTYLYERLDNS